MKAFVATRDKQGKRKNDFCHCREGELVTFTMECDGETVDGKCGCKRSMCGIETGKATTTFKVKEMKKGVVSLEDMLLLNCEVMGIPKSPELIDMCKKDAVELERLSNLFEAGTVLERRGRTMRERK
jgi:hypothetical protein